MNLPNPIKNQETSPEQLRKTADELRNFSQDLQGKFDAAKAQHKKAMRRYRFFYRDRANYWKMPKWLWVPLVAALVLLFLLALLSVG